MSNVRVFIEKVLFDPKVGASVILLKECEGERLLPIWIGQSEALSIAMALENIRLPRPMTHDLMSSILERLDVSVSWVRIHDLNEGTFYAALRLSIDGTDTDIDSRPSDAIAVALRTGAPIFVKDAIMEESGQSDSEGAIDSADEDFLSELPDEVFGKYKM